MRKLTQTLPWKGFRNDNTNDNDASSGDPGNPEIVGRHSDHIFRPSPTEQQRPSSPVVESNPRFQLPDDSQMDLDPGALNNTKTRKRELDPTRRQHQQQTAKRNRFSLMRFRHASDPQLSASFQKSEAPPVPPRKNIPSSLFSYIFFPHESR